MIGTCNSTLVNLVAVENRPGNSWCIPKTGLLTAVM
jgi:hypothetical protein